VRVSGVIVQGAASLRDAGHPAALDYPALAPLSATINQQEVLAIWG
jgi:hypothetical protein